MPAHREVTSWAFASWSRAISGLYREALGRVLEQTRQQAREPARPMEVETGILFGRAPLSGGHAGS
jgi:hypothetical protein